MGRTNAESPAIAGARDPSNEVDEKSSLTNKEGDSKELGSKSWKERDADEIKKLTKMVSKRVLSQIQRNEAEHSWMEWMRLPKCSGRYATTEEIGETDDDTDGMEGEEDSLLHRASESSDKKTEEELYILLRIIIVLLYVGIGLMFYGTFEKWSPLECIYFIVVTLSTVGYGDLHPSSWAGQIFTIFYAIVGICIVFRLVFWLFARILDKHEKFLITVISANTDDDFVQMRENLRRLRAKKWRNTIVFSTISLTLYALVGTLYWSLFQSLPVSTSLYLVVTTLLTIGYGDIAPGQLRHGALVFSIFFVTSGVCIFGYIVSKLADIYLEYIQNEKRGRVLKQKLSRRRIRKMLREGKISANENVTNVAKMEWGTFLTVMLIEMELADKQSIMEIRARFDELMQAEEKKKMDRQLQENLTDLSHAQVPIPGDAEVGSTY